MTRDVSISDENWMWLQSLARPLEDTVDDVLDRLRLSQGEAKEDVSKAVRVLPPLEVADISEVADVIRGTTPRRRRRLERGRKVPLEEFKQPILLALRAAGGQGRPAEILPKVERRVKHLLTDIDYVRISSGAVRWEKSANWARLELVHDGLIDGSVWGLWKLTQKGRISIGAEAQ